MRTLGSCIDLVLGMAGLVLGGFFAWLYWKVISGPGDDNPIGLLFMAAVALSLLPAWGLVRALRGRPWSSLDLIWAGASTVVVVVLALFARPFL